ncbi:MAG: hypothetical protein IIT48_00180 [Lachnospiraceae bacterium]|nr:hypothetical protein [Lachnospiraceae bacterium]
MYRSGFQISNTSLMANIILAIILFLIGIIFLHEPITARKVIGIVVCIAGVYLIK